MKLEDNAGRQVFFFLIGSYVRWTHRLRGGDPGPYAPHRDRTTGTGRSRKLIDGASGAHSASGCHQLAQWRWHYCSHGLPALNVSSSLRLSATASASASGREPLSLPASELVLRGKPGYILLELRATLDSCTTASHWHNQSADWVVIGYIGSVEGSRREPARRHASMGTRQKGCFGSDDKVLLASTGREAYAGGGFHRGAATTHATRHTL